MRKIIFNENKNDKNKAGDKSKLAVTFVAASILFESIFGCATVKQETSFEQGLKSGEIAQQIAILSKQREKTSGSEQSEKTSQLLKTCNEVKVHFNALVAEVNACDGLKGSKELDDEVKTIVEKECKDADLNKKREMIKTLSDLVKKCDEALFNVLQ